MSAESNRTESLSPGDYLNSEDATNVTYKDISHLSENIHSINVLFGEVMRTLQTYDSESPDPKGALEPQWAALRKEFNQCVGDSRDCATSAAGITGVYADAVLGKVEEVHCNVRDLLDEIKTLREEVERHLKTAKDVHSNFHELSLKIEDFKNKVEFTLELKDIGGPLLEKLRALQKKVATIPKEILDPYMEYFESVATFAPSMSKTLGILSPTVAIEAFHDTIGGNQAKMKLVRETVLKDIGNVAQSIQVIADIWKNLRADMQILETQLSNHESRGEVAEDARLADYPFIKPQIQTSRDVCKALSKCLMLYVRTSRRP